MYIKYCFVNLIILKNTCEIDFYVDMHACSVASDSATPWTITHLAPLFMGFSGQEDWSGLPYPTPGDLPDLGIEAASPVSPALTGGFFTTVPPGKPFYTDI